MKDQSGIFTDFDEYLIEEEKNLNLIYKDLIKNNQDKYAIKKFDRIVKSKIDYRGLIPCSKSYEGENLLTLSKTWMILILLKITKGKAQQDQFLTLVNSSLTHQLNEYDEYKNFFEDQCEVLFSEEEAIKQINLNPKLPKNIDNSISHDELRDYYIYLLFKPNYFQKTELDGLSKIKKKDKVENNKKRISENSIKSNRNKSNKSRKSNNTSSIILNSGSDSEENDEKGDRLNEKDMISKNRAKQPSYKNSTKNKKLSNRKSIKEDEVYNKINDILNKSGKNKKKEEKTKKKNKKSSLKSSDLEDEDEYKEKEDIDIDKEENKKGKKNKKKITLKDKKSTSNKKKIYKEEFEENEESEEENEISKKKGNKYKKEKLKEKEKEKKNKKDKKNKKPNKNTKSSEIFELLGIDKDLIESEEEENEDNKKTIKNKSTKGRKSTSVPQKSKKDNSKNKTKLDDSTNKNKKQMKEKTKNSEKKSTKTKKTKKNKKNKKSKTDEEDSLSEDDLINSLSELSFESDRYEANLDKIKEDEKMEMEREIKAALKGDTDEFDLEGLLEDSKIEGINLSNFDSNEDIDSEMEE